ncbi:hypothetical protein BGZ49_009772, partial [Haplosporangium sp. Z 27]
APCSVFEWDATKMVVKMPTEVTHGASEHPEDLFPWKRNLQRIHKRAWRFVKECILHSPKDHRERINSVDPTDLYKNKLQCGHSKSLKPATDITNSAANTTKKQAENIKDELHCEHEIEQVFHQEHFIVVDLDSRHPQYSYSDHAEDRNTKRCHEYFDISGIDNVYYSETQE